MAYQPNIPTGSVPLNQDYLNIQGNFSTLNNTFSVDHSPLTGTLPPTGTAGYHTQVHFVPFSNVSGNPPNNYPPTQPTATGGYGQLWSAQVNDGINSDEALFWLTGGGRNIQLTSNLVPVTTNNSNRNGYTFLPGGIIFQWGIKSKSSSATTVKFNDANIDFPNKCFVVIAQPISGGGSFYNVSSISQTQFDFVSTFPNGTPFNWIAIGN